jgi:hypothetical protein
MNIGKILLLLGGGVAIWWYFEQQNTTTTATPVTTTQITPPAITPVSTTGSTPTSGSTTPPATTPPGQGSNPYVAITAQLAAAGDSTSSLMSADQWNYFAAQAYPTFSAPAPETLFPALANTPSTVNAGLNASHDPVSFSTWWAAISPYLPTTVGVSGMGSWGGWAA